jgi:hypothetical protein
VRLRPALECDVSIIDAASLSTIDPNSGKRTPAKGCDAADALADWPDSGELRKTAACLAKPFDPGPAYVSFHWYATDASGLAVEIECGPVRGETNGIGSNRCAVRNARECRDPHGGGWGKTLRRRNDDGRPHVRHVANADLHGSRPLFAPALRIGVCISTGYANAALSATCQRCNRNSALPSFRGRAGMTSAGNPSLSCRARRSGPRGVERVIVDAASAAHEVRGTIEEWRAGVSALAGGHVLAVLAASRSPIPQRRPGPSWRVLGLLRR